MRLPGGVTALIEHVRANVRDQLTVPSSHAVRDYAQIFDRAAAQVRGSPAELNIFVFHVDVPASHRVINYVDVQHDHWEFDYRALTSHFLWATLHFNMRARVYYVTSESAEAPDQHPDVTLVRLPVDPRAPMYERVKAMAAYASSRAFSAKTVFLDSDAYPNRSLAGVFKRTFDVGVTYRTTPGYMPLNEGVIFASRHDLTAAQRFFRTYLATYDALRQDVRVLSYYENNIDRWRGGQLSLNAVGLPDGPFAPLFTARGIRIAMFPCNQFNYWVTKPIQPEQRTWDRKFVLHLKGNSKHLLQELTRYQLARRAPRYVASQPARDDLEIA